MKATTLWQQYCRMCGQDATECPPAFQFGVLADELAELVCKGIKTATASAYDLYVLENAPLPQVGDYAIVLNGQDEAQCIVRTIAVDVVRFNEVTADHAYREGEGNRTLAYWCQVHELFWREELAAVGLVFTSDMRVVCELFEVVYQAQ